jgi:hypothetical protein
METDEITRGSAVHVKCYDKIADVPLRERPFTPTPMFARHRMFCLQCYCTIYPGYEIVVTDTNFPIPF